MRVSLIVACAAPLAMATWLQARAHTFDEYPIYENTRFEPAPVNFGTASVAARFRARLADGAKDGPNFAGHYTVVTLSCGATCWRVAVINALTGALTWFPRPSAMGVRYQLFSSLLIDGAPEDWQGGQPLTVPLPANAYTYYWHWTGRRFQLVDSVRVPSRFTDTTTIPARKP